MIKIFHLFLAIFALSAATNGIAADNFLTKTIKSPKGDVTLEWRISASNLEIKLKAPTEGWLGVGFNDRNGMKHGHLIMVAVDKSGKVTFSERIGESDNRAPTEIQKLGGKTHVTAESGKRERGASEVDFTIPLATGEKAYFDIDKTKKVVVLVAYAMTPNFNSQHFFRQFFTLDLQTGS